MALILLELSSVFPYRHTEARALGGKFLGKENFDQKTIFAAKKIKKL